MTAFFNEYGIIILSVYLIVWVAILVIFKFLETKEDREAEEWAQRHGVPYFPKMIYNAVTALWWPVFGCIYLGFFLYGCMWQLVKVFRDLFDLGRNEKDR